jgi:hypothetical protein
MTVPVRLQSLVILTLVAAAATALVLVLPAAANAQSLQGRWVLSPERSSFVEAITGPAPQAGEWTVSRDDGDRLAYTLVETREGEVVARAAYDVSLHGGLSQSHVGSDARNVVAARVSDGSTLIQAPAVDAWRASIRIHQVNPREAVIEHILSGPNGDLVVDHMVMERASTRLVTAAADKDALR